MPVIQLLPAIIAYIVLHTMLYESLLCYWYAQHLLVFGGVAFALWCCARRVDAQGCARMRRVVEGGSMHSKVVTIWSSWWDEMKWEMITCVVLYLSTDSRLRKGSPSPVWTARACAWEGNIVSLLKITLIQFICIMQSLVIKYFPMIVLNACSILYYLLVW